MHSVNGKVRCSLAMFAIVVSIFLLSFAPLAMAQNSYPDAMNFFKNYFVTGDYVAGGVGLRGTGVNGWATGNIYFDAAHQNQVPQDAVVVAAFLYWEAIESTDQPSTMNGYFQGYPIVGVAVPAASNSPEGPNTPPCWSSGGGTGSSNGSKHLRVYRADVAPYLVINGVYGINTPASTPYQVKLQDSGSNGAGTPLTEGASLVIVYRSLSAGTFKSVVIYNGAWTMNNAFPYMSQTIQGFYEAQAGTAKITHIVGDGQVNFGENVTVADGTDSQTTPNPFYGAQGYSWDNTTFPLSVSAIAQGSVANPLTTFTTQVLPNANSFDCLSWGAVVASMPVVDTDGDGLLDVWEQNQGYSDQKTNADGSHDWVALPGAQVNQKDLFVQIDYLNNTGAAAQQYGEIAHSHLPKYSALQKIGEAFQYSGGMRVHFDVGANYQGITPAGNDYSYIIPHSSASDPGDPWQGGNSLDEDTISCSDGATLCQSPYPNAGPGIVWWKGSIEFAKNSLSVRANPQQANTYYPFFEHGRNDSYHYVLMGHALGLPSQVWSKAAGTLVGITVNSGNQATITLSQTVTPTPTGRVTISGAVGDLNLNGTYQASFSGNTITVITPNVTVAPNTEFDFGVFGNSAANPTGLGVYSVGTVKYVNEPNLVVSGGAPLSTSGFSDLGGGDSLVTLGLWSADDPSGCQSDPSKPLTVGQAYCNNQVGSDLVQAGTIMHEIGHTLFLTHGGFYPNYPSAGQNSFGQNCKPNYLSVMNYLFQIRGLPDAYGTLDSGFNPKEYVDFSGQTLYPLDENNLVESNGLGYDVDGHVPAYGTRWYAPPGFLDKQIQSFNSITGGNHILTHYCDGTPSPSSTVVRVEGPSVALVNGTPAPIGVNWNNQGTATETISQDINFDSFLDGLLGAPLPSPGPNPAPDMDNDWLHMNLQQLGARRNVGGYSVDVTAMDLAATDQGSQILGGGSQILGGGSQILGGGSQILGGGSDLVNGGSQILGGGSQILGGGSQILGGGSQILGGGSQILGGGVELDFDTANTVVAAPVNLVAISPAKRTAYLTWYPPNFGQIRVYYVWRADISKAPIGPKNPPTVVKTIGSLNSTVPPTTTCSNGVPYCYTDTGLKTNATYVYFVTSALGKDSGPNAGNQSSPSNLFQVQIQ